LHVGIVRVEYPAAQRVRLVVPSRNVVPVTHIRLPSQKLNPTSATMTVMTMSQPHHGGSGDSMYTIIG
jgi:hypothetical protein